jgi:glycogen synthase
MPQVAWLVSAYKLQKPSASVILHGHEWLSAVGLILLRRRAVDVATVFTTHATLVGRYVCADTSTQIDFFNALPSLNADAEACAPPSLPSDLPLAHRGIAHRHALEKGAAQSAHVFTTVSEITAMEAKFVLGREADVIVPNGLVLDNFAALHEHENLHAKYKDVVHQFVKGHFYGHYDFDLSETLYFFTAGRYEYHNKGADIFLDALGTLNDRLKAQKSKKTVVAFIIMPAPNRGFNADCLKVVLKSFLSHRRGPCHAAGPAAQRQRPQEADRRPHHGSRPPRRSPQRLHPCVGL